MRLSSIPWVLVLLLTVAAGLQADLWIVARMLTVQSPNGIFMATITPATTDPVNTPCIARLFLLDSLGSGSLVWRVEMVNEVCPNSAVLTDSGQLITFDEWGNVGGPNAMTIYDHAGQLVRTYDLEEFIPKSLMRRLNATTSSVWWWFSASVEARTDTLCVLVKTDGRTPDSLTNKHSLKTEYAIRELRICLTDGVIVTPIDTTPAGIKSWQVIAGP